MATDWLTDRLVDANGHWPEGVRLIGLCRSGRLRACIQKWLVHPRQCGSTTSPSHRPCSTARMLDYDCSTQNWLHCNALLSNGPSLWQKDEKREKARGTTDTQTERHRHRPTATDRQRNSMSCIAIIDPSPFPFLLLSTLSCSLHSLIHSLFLCLFLQWKASQFCLPFHSECVFLFLFANVICEFMRTIN